MDKILSVPGLTWKERSTINRKLSPATVLEKHGFVVTEEKTGEKWATYGLHEGADNPKALKITYKPEENAYLWYGFSDPDFNGRTVEILAFFNDYKNKEGLADRVIKEYEEITGEKIKNASDNYDPETKRKIYLHDNYIKKCNEYLNNFKTPDNPDKPYQGLINRGYTLEQLNKKLIGYDPYIDCYIFPIEIDGIFRTNIKRRANYIINNYRNQEINFYSCKDSSSSYDEFNRHLNTRKNYIKITGESRYCRDYDLEVKKLSKNVVYNYDSVKNNSRKLFINEGIVDSDNLVLNGYSCITRIGAGSGKEAFDKFIIPACKNNYKNKEIIIINDNDKTGKKFNFEIIKQFLDNGIFNFSVMVTPKTENEKNKIDILKKHFKSEDKDYFKDSDHYKDINDWYTEHYNSLDGIFKTKINWLEYTALALSLDEADSDNDYRALLGLEPTATFTDVLKNYYRFIPKDRLNNLFSFLEENNLENSDTIKDLKKLINYAPPEDVVAREVEKKYTLLFRNDNFYEYKNNQWEQIEKKVIEKYVGKELGRFKTSRLCSNVRNLIAGDTVVTGIEFDSENVLVFQDGTLETDTFKFRPSRKEDYNTFKLDYSYNPDEEIDCPIFDKFIDDITNGNEEKKNVLLEFGGYGFFPDQRFKKLLFLTGNGDNGKSVYTDIIADVFGSTGGSDGLGNVSKVKYGLFGNDFYRIQMKNKRFNFCDEITEDVKGDEPTLKAITGGDYITGAHKHVDGESFKCNAKLIFTGNSLPITKDKVSAYFNRFIIVDLPNSYVVNPTEKNQKKADLNLRDKLKTERSSIIKRFIEANKQLQENGKFTKIKESEELLEEYREVSTPILQFVNELLEEIALRLATINTEGTEMFETLAMFVPINEQHLIKKEDCEPRKDRIFLKGKTLFDYYSRYIEENKGKTKYSARFSQEFKKIILEKHLGKPTNRGSDGGRGFILYKNRIAELTGYNIDEEFILFRNEEEHNEIKKLINSKDTLIEEMAKEKFELIENDLKVYSGD